MAQAVDVFSGGDPGARVREIKAWLKAKGVPDFEPVSLFCDQLSKVIHTHFHSGPLAIC